MKALIIKPAGWPCSLAECPPGLFVTNDSHAIGLKTEYGDMEVYNSAGEIFWGGAKTKEERSALLVIPCFTEWQEWEK